MQQVHDLRKKPQAELPKLTAEGFKCLDGTAKIFIEKSVSQVDLAENEQFYQQLKKLKKNVNKK